jgi:hypothetical protein
VQGGEQRDKYPDTEAPGVKGSRVQRAPASMADSDGQSRANAWINTAVQHLSLGRHPNSRVRHHDKRDRRDYVCPELRRLVVHHCRDQESLLWGNYGYNFQVDRGKLPPHSQSPSIAVIITKGQDRLQAIYSVIAGNR